MLEIWLKKQFLQFNKSRVSNADKTIPGEFVTGKSKS